MKSYSLIEPMHRFKNRINRAKHTASLLLALVGVMAMASQIFVSTARTSTAASLPGDLKTRRSQHTATLLTTGKVVIAGGETGLAALGFSGEELFDPETGTWSVTGNIQAPRIGHTATLLTDGKVLVAAGFGIADLPIDSAELYDPATGKWSATGNLNMPRFAHTATLLPDGRVLVAGGVTGRRNDRFETLLKSAELYDPTTGAWSETGKLNTFRSRHSATLLQNGKVLVAGGVSDFDTDLIDVAVSELYDPDTGTWSTTGKLNTYRFNHTATLLQNGKILVAGGANGSVLIDSAELYDPDTGTWSNTGNLNIPRNDPATLLHSGKVLVAGSDTAELYDPQAGTWSRTAGLNAPRVSYTATLLPDGRVLAAGGKSSSSAAKLNSSEIFEPDTETWIGPPLPVITGTSIVGKKLLVFGDNFVPGAVVFRNGTALKTKNSGDTRTLVAKGKAGKKIRPGDRLHVLNPSGALSKEFVFSDS